MAVSATPSKGHTIATGDKSLTADLPKTGPLYIGTGGTLIVLLANETDNTNWITFNPGDDRDFPYEVRRISPASTAADMLVFTQ